MPWHTQGMTKLTFLQILQICREHQSYQGLAKWTWPKMQNCIYWNDIFSQMRSPSSYRHIYIYFQPRLLGVSRLTSNPKVNPGQPSNITCHAFGNPSPRFDNVYLTSDLGKSSSSGKGIVSRSVTVTETVTDPETIFVFDIAAVEKREMFSCTLAEESRTAILAVWSRTYGKETLV